jgi:hypothetical protein
MENQDTSLSNAESPSNELIISKKSENYLNETERWTKFLSIVGFVLVGIMVIVALFASSIFSAIPFDQDNNFGGGMGFLLPLSIF